MKRYILIWRTSLFLVVSNEMRVGGLSLHSTQSNNHFVSLRTIQDVSLYGTTKKQ